MREFFTFLGCFIVTIGYIFELKLYTKIIIAVIGLSMIIVAIWLNPIE